MYLQSFKLNINFCGMQLLYISVSDEFITQLDDKIVANLYGTFIIIHIYVKVTATLQPSIQGLDAVDWLWQIRLI